MKNIAFLIVLLSVFCCQFVSGRNKTDNYPATQNSASAGSNLNIMTVPELNGVASDWLTEYGKLNPSLKPVISNITDRNIGQLSSLCLVTEEHLASISNESFWKMVVGREAIVPVMNANHPILDRICSRGLSQEDFGRMLEGKSGFNWGKLISGGQDASITAFIVNNEFIRNRIARFAGLEPTMIQAKMVEGADDLFSAMKRDTYAIGFCKLTDIIDKANNSMVAGIRIIPIDRNQNGRIDYFENIYTDLNAFTRGVWIGKYPALLSGNIYAVAPDLPENQNEQAFLTWLNADGQKFLSHNGFSELGNIQKQENVRALAPVAVFTDETAGHSYTGILFFSLFILVVAGLIFTIVAIIRREKSGVVGENVSAVPGINEKSILAPGGLFFDKTHTWAFMEKNGMVRIGIDDFLQHLTGQVTQVKLKMAGDLVRKGEKLLTIVHEGKQLNIYAPVSGTIIEHNLKLVTDSEIINSAPYSDGWIYMMEPRNWLREIQFMFMSDRYTDWLKDEFARLREFFASSFRPDSVAYAHAVLQDGGEITDHVLADLDPEVWEDFQIHFIDKSR